MFKMYSCKDISKLTCNQDDMSFLEKVNYKLHIFICGNCSNYVESIELVGNKFSKVLKSRRKTSPEKITRLENQILESLNKKNESK